MIIQNVQDENSCIHLTSLFDDNTGEQICRKCGKELEVEKKCYSCNEPTVFHCTKCIYSTAEQIHFECQAKMIEVSIKR